MEKTCAYYYYYQFYLIYRIQKNWKGFGLFAVWIRMNGVWGQEGTEVTPAPPQFPFPRAEENNATGQLVFIPPVPLAFTYPGPLPLPGVSWPILGGINYIAEGRFPYNGYVGAQSPQLQFLHRVRQPQPYRRRKRR